MTSGCYETHTHASVTSLAPLPASLPAGAAPNTLEVVAEAEKYYKGEGVARDLSRAAVLWKAAADCGNAGAQFCLATMHYFGEGVPVDLSSAATLLKQAADQGHASAQFNLGCMHDKGEGVPQDKARAATLYEAAAD